MTRRSRRSTRITRALRGFDILGFITLIAFAVTMASRAHAAEPGGGAGERLLERLDLTYEAPSPPVCPSRRDLAAAIVRRIEPDWLTRAEPRRFTVRIARVGERRFDGRLDVEHAGRARGRDIHGTTCAEVTAALAVFIAIALDPVSEESLDEPEHLRNVPDADGAPKPVDDASVDATPSKEPPPSSTTALPETSSKPTPARLASRPDVPSSLPSAVWTWSADVSISYLRVPEPAWGARVGAELARRWRTVRWSPALRLSWGFADFATYPDRAGKVSFRYETAQVAGCAVVDLAPLPIRISPCAGVDLGTLTSTARDLRRGSQVEGQWRAANVFARFAWSLLPWLSIEMQGGVLFPFERSTFGLSQPARVAYQPPSVVFASTAGFGVHARF